MSVSIVLVGLGGVAFSSQRASAEDANQYIRDNGAVFTYLLDTNVRSASPLSPEAIVDKAGWTVLPEDDSSHAFAGDTVILNENLAVVLRRGGPGAEVYTARGGGFIPRAALVPLPAAGKAIAGLERLQIIENTPGAVALRAVFGEDQSRPVAMDYRLTTGQITVEIRSEQGAGALSVRVPTTFLVVPDFFGNDVVYNAALAPWHPQTSLGVSRLGDPAPGTHPSYHLGVPRARVGLPAENFFIHLVGAGEAIVTCVWESNRQNARATLSGERTSQVIDGSEIDCAEGEKIWVAFLEGDGLWHSSAFSPQETETTALLDWKPPFAAKWCADCLSGSEMAESSEVGDGPGDSGNTPKLSLGGATCQCWFEGDKAYVRRAPQSQTSQSSSRAGTHTVVVYPIDRTQATPLNVFLLIDIMRNTLGVGACRYILDLEGLDATSNPTPALVMEWFEKQIKKNVESRNVEAARERLGAMVTHIRHTEERIAAYEAFGARIKGFFHSPDATDSSAMATRRDVIRTIEDLRLTLASSIPATKTPELAEELADQLLNLMGEENPLPQCDKVAAELCAIGAAQDRALAACRMAVRRVKQLCLTVEADHIVPPAWLTRIRQEAEQMLTAASPLRPAEKG